MAMELEYRNESQLQQECVVWFKNTHLDQRQRLWATFNEGKSVTTKLPMGMTPGVCDLLYYGPDERLYGFELKVNGSHHGVKHLITQAKWMLRVLPGHAWFIDSVEDFKSRISGMEGGIDPMRVLTYCEGLKKASIVWDRRLFL